MRIILVISIVLITIKLKAQWTLTPCPTTVNLKSIHFGSQNVGYAVGDAGTILKTIDQGVTWAISTQTGTNTINSVNCLNKDTAFCVGTGGNDFKTVNGGVAWTNITLTYTVNSHTNISVISLTPRFTYYVGNIFVRNWTVAGYPWQYVAVGGLSKDFGTTWTDDMLGTTFDHSYDSPPLNSVCFIDTLNGYACGTNVIRKTINGGNNWIALSSTSGYTYNSVCFVNPNIGWVAGNNGLIRKTTDGGITWSTQIGVGGTNHLRSIYFPTPNVGYCVGDNGTILVTLDGGDLWLMHHSGTTNNLNSVFFTNATTGFIVGNNGTILTTGNGPIGLKEFSPQNSELRVYPNPATDFITIQHKAVDGFIKLYDVIGNEILSEAFTEESNKIDISKLSKGLYFLKIENGPGNYAQKIIKE